MVGMTRPEVRTLRDAAPLAALAHPFRSRIMDALKVDGPSTASMLAARTGQAVGNASHHLKVLAAAGLVEEAPELARDRRERWWRLVERRHPVEPPRPRRPRPRSPPPRRPRRSSCGVSRSGSATGWPTPTPTPSGTTRRSPPRTGCGSAPPSSASSPRGPRAVRRWSNREVPDDGIAPRAGVRLRPRLPEPAVTAGTAPVATRRSPDRRQPQLPPALVRRGRLGSRVDDHRGRRARSSPSPPSTPAPRWMGLLTAAAWLPWLARRPAGRRLGRPRRRPAGDDRGRPRGRGVRSGRYRSRGRSGVLTLPHLVVAALRRRHRVGVPAHRLPPRSCPASSPPATSPTANARLVGTESAMQVVGPGLGGAPRRGRLRRLRASSPTCCPSSCSALCLHLMDRRRMLPAVAARRRREPLRTEVAAGIRVVAPRPLPALLHPPGRGVELRASPATPRCSCSSSCATSTSTRAASAS